MANCAEFLLNLSRHAPDRVALSQGCTEITYRELGVRVDRLAGYLQQLGVVSGGTVAIWLERSDHWVIAALSAMCVGAAYCPLDTAWPDERLRRVIADSGASVVVSTAELSNRLSLDLPIVDPRRESAAIAAASPVEPVEITGEMLAYVIYTSGSTGDPKGVEITHSNLASLIAWHREAFQVSEEDRASHLAGLAFDAAAWELWPYLAVGATVCMVSESVRTSAELLQEWLLRERITIGFVPTALAATLIQLPWPKQTHLRYLLTGGDTLHRGPADDVPFLLVNNYGPTECTVVATSGVVPADRNNAPTIGFPVKGATVYVLREDGTPADLGEMGEIYIGGAGVGRGYRNLQDLTAQKFRSDPFSTAAGARMYRTGDQGILLADGQIAFRGRRDGQVKIRGQRVELGEIESALTRHPGVAFAAVVVNTERADEQSVIAYVSPSAAHVPSSSDLQEFLARALPGYMIPSTFVRLDSIPLTANGKLDKFALPAPSSENLLSRHGGRTVLTQVEEALLSVVRGLLKTDDVSVADDFFLIGGHSLLGTQFVLRIRQMFGIQFTLRELFETPTVERLAVSIEAKLIADVDALAEDEALRQVGADLADCAG